MYGTCVEVTCEEGYLLHSGNLSQKITCMGAQGWDAEPENCTGKKLTSLGALGMHAEPIDCTGRKLTSLGALGMHTETVNFA